MKRLLSIILITFGFTAPCYAKEVAGINLADSISIDGIKLELNGAGLREKWIFDVYAAALYLQTPSGNAQDIITLDDTMVITLEMLRGVSGADMTAAIYEGFKSAMNGNTSSMDSKIKDFLKVFGTEAAKGNMYKLAYIPEIGVEVSINGVKQNTIVGTDFKEVLFTIWLGDKPAQDSLKKSLLGN
jgi:hypothetical protein